MTATVDFPPSSPQVSKGTDALRTHLTDVASRDIDAGKIAWQRQVQAWDA